MTTVSVEHSYAFRQIKTQLKALLDLRDSNQVEVVDNLRKISTSYCLNRTDNRVGIRLFYNLAIDYLTDDTKTDVVQKAIENVETILKARAPNTGRKFKDSSFSLQTFYSQLHLIASRLSRVETSAELKNLHSDFTLVLLDNLSAHNGINEFSAEHPMWTYSARNISVVISLEHYRKAHYLTKLYGFKSCAILMSFALTEYLELLKQKRSCCEYTI